MKEVFEPCPNLSVAWSRTVGTWKVAWCMDNKLCGFVGYGSCSDVIPQLPSIVLLYILLFIYMAFG